MSSYPSTTRLRLWLKRMFWKLTKCSLWNDIKSLHVLMCLSFCPIGLKMWCSDGKDYHEVLISSSFSNNIHHLDRKRREQRTKLYHNLLSLQFYQKHNEAKLWFYISLLKITCNKSFIYISNMTNIKRKENTKKCKNHRFKWNRVQ